MKRSSIATLALGAAFAAGSLGVTQVPAKADTGSTVAIAAGAAAIVGTLLIDSNSHRSYYVRNNHRYYVSNDVATYYHSHHNRGYAAPRSYGHGNASHGYQSSDHRNDHH